MKDPLRAIRRTNVPIHWEKDDYKNVSFDEPLWVLLTIEK